ncbi:MAG: hypothetical protein COB69_02405 [Phycisphaera sp.]|nr:MAG: hypothetical protein COB69_02405 [Phycisphaera sp.]
MVNESIAEALDHLLQGRTGKRETPDSVARFREKLGHIVPEWYTEMMLRWPLGGAPLYFPHLCNSACMRWNTLDSILDDTYNYGPSMFIYDHGYITVAQCAMCTGDPYFIPFFPTTIAQIVRYNDEPDNPPLIQVFHDALDIEEQVTPDACVVVAQNLSGFFLHAGVADEELERDQFDA